MPGSTGQPLIPTSVEMYLTAMLRRISELEARTRGQGRAAWLPVQTPYRRGMTVLDGAYPGWRQLNDGRIELRGHLQILPTAPIRNGDVVLRLPTLNPMAPTKRFPECRPPGLSSVSVLLPCSASGTNPGVIRADIRRIPDATDDDVEFAEVVARPPQSAPLTDWIGFDSVSYDPYLYIDALPTVAPAARAQTFGVNDYGLTVVTLGDRTIPVVPGLRAEPPERKADDVQ